MRFQLGICACVAALLVFPSSTWASGEFELNDSRDTAYGPLEGGKSYTATFETENDNDWYVFYIRTYSQMDFSATAVGASTCEIADFDLLDKDGKLINGFDSGFVNETKHLQVTLDAGRYYFEVQSNEFSGCNGDVEADLAAIGKRWEKFLAKWKTAVRRLGRQHRLSGYVRRQRMRSLLASKRRTNLRLKAQENTAKRKLVAAQKAQAKVLEQRAGLQALEAQSKATQSQAEAQIAAHC